MPIKPLNEILVGDENMFQSPVTEFFGKLFQSRDMAHIIHLSTQNYEVHMATNTYYTKIIDLVDSLVESYQGLHGLINIKIPASYVCNELIYFQDMIGYVQISRKLFNDTNLLNKIDDIIDLLSSTIYKLRFLK